MILKDFHIHTNYCDGKHSPRDIVSAAISQGMKEIGILCHSYMDFDQSYCIKKDQIENFKAEINALKNEYKDRIKILCGVEQDYFSNETTVGFDYIIGGVHYVKKDGNYLDVDLSEEAFVNSVKTFYNGDFLAFSEDYFELVGKICEKTSPDIIAHFDLVTKFNQNNKWFNTNDSRYLNAAKKAVDKLIPYNKPFEINTGAISRGYRMEPYPEKNLIEYIKEKGGKLILSSDSHSKDTLCYKFNEYEYLL